MKKTISVSVIIVSYNTLELLKNCLKSILQQPNTNLQIEIIVVDNASTDGTQEFIKNHFTQVNLIINNTNDGFAKANNQGVKVAKGEYVLFLNSDTIVHDDAIAKLVKAAALDNRNIASCRLLNSDGTIQPQGGFLPNKSNILAWMLGLDDIPLIKYLFLPYHQDNLSFFEKNQDIGWLSGAALLVKKSYFLDLGGFDENMFMYGEDVELCMRASKKSSMPRYYADPSITHLGHQSSSQAHALVGEFRGLIHIVKKHHPNDLSVIKSTLRLGANIRKIFFSTIKKDTQKREAYEKALEMV